MTLPERNTVFWWLYITSLAVAALFIAHSFIGILVLGLFGYYATRPICTRFHHRIDSKGLAAAATVLVLLVPLLLIVLYLGLRVIQQAQQRFEDGVIPMLVSRAFGMDVENAGLTQLLDDPPSVEAVTDLVFGSTAQQSLQVLDALFGTVMLVTLAATLSYALLVYDDALSEAFTELVGGPEETVSVYARAVDTDLESVFFGNFLFVIVMSVLATVTYLLTNLVAPPGLAVPMVFTLGLLTGVTSLIPIIVSKVIYLPIVGFLALSAGQGPEENYLFVGGVLVAYFLILDILPQSVLQPYISGRQLNPMLLLFAYILGPILFGWYGFFFLPIVFVLMLEAVRIVLPELLHGNPIVSEPELAEDTGAEAEEIEEETESEAQPGSNATGDGQPPPGTDATGDGPPPPGTDEQPGDAG